MSDGSNESHDSHFLSLQTLIAIIMLLMYTIAAPLFEKYHFHYMHESGVCMIIGVIITLCAAIINPEVKLFFFYIVEYLSNSRIQ